MKFLESSGYRCIFECAKDIGVEPTLLFSRDVRRLCGRKDLIERAVLYGQNDLSWLIRNNKSVVSYLRNYKEYLNGNVLEGAMTYLEELYERESLIDLYIENAKLLERLGVSRVRYNDMYYIKNEFYNSCIYRNSSGKIIQIVKYYTDGVLSNVSDEIITGTFRVYGGRVCTSSNISFNISDEPLTYLLKVENRERFQSRSIDVYDFGFDSSTFPSEEELSSYEVPKKLLIK